MTETNVEYISCLWYILQHIEYPNNLSIARAEACTYGLEEIGGNQVFVWDSRSCWLVRDVQVRKLGR